MKCKHCGCELVEGKPFCPSCGKSQEDAVQPEMKEGMKATPGKIAIAVAAVVVVLALLVALVIGGMDSDLLNPDPTIAPTAGMVETVPEETVIATAPADGNPDDVTCKGSYSVTDEEAIAAADTVVATMGGKELTNAQLQVYYWEEVFNFLQQYGSYAAYFGLDYTKGLDVQLFEAGEQTMTWQQYFLDSALNSWRSYQSMALEAEENGFEMDAETRAYLDGLRAEMESNATQNGFESLEAMIENFVGAGPDVEDYIRYIELYHEGYTYFSHIYDNTNPTAEEVEAYFAENEESFAASGITKESVSVDVRHILIMPEGGTTGEDGYPSYTEEAWTAALAEAEKIYAEWKNGDRSEDSFAQFAQEYSVDGSAANGGLYTGVTEGQMVPAFNDWCFDTARQEGDHDLIRTEYGYHIMFFCGTGELWYTEAETALINEITANLVPDAMEKYPAEVDYSAIKLAICDLT